MAVTADISLADPDGPQRLDAPPPLQYATPLPWYRGRFVRRGLLLLAVAVVAGAAWNWYPVVRDRARLTHAQGLCLRHAASPDTVVLEQDPARAARLLADPRYTRTTGSTPAALLIPAHWSNLYAAVSPPGLKSHGTAFLHSRLTPSGERRLVAVDLWELNAAWNGPDCSLEWRVFAPGSLLRRPAAIASGGGTRLFADRDSPVRVYAGQPDPADPSHFTLHYELRGRRHTLDGWLRDDDTVLLERREP